MFDGREIMANNKYIKKRQKKEKIDKKTIKCIYVKIVMPGQQPKILSTKYNNPICQYSDRIKYIIISQSTGENKYLKLLG